LACKSLFRENRHFAKIVISRKSPFRENRYFAKIAISRKSLFRENRHFAKIVISRKSLFQENRYLETLTWLDFFANRGRSTPRGRSQSYKVSGKLASLEFFAKSQNNDREKTHFAKQRQFSPKFVGLAPAPRGRSPLICKKIEQYLWKFKIIQFFSVNRYFAQIAILKNCYFINKEGVGRFTPNFVRLNPAPRGLLPIICEKSMNFLLLSIFGWIFC
jgi:hypothetical protein